MMQKGDAGWLRTVVLSETEAIYQLLRGAQAILDNVLNSPTDEKAAYGLIDMALVRLIELQGDVEGTKEGTEQAEAEVRQ